MISGLHATLARIAATIAPQCLRRRRLLLSLPSCTRTRLMDLPYGQQAEKGTAAFSLLSGSKERCNKDQMQRAAAKGNKIDRL